MESTAHWSEGHNREHQEGQTQMGLGHVSSLGALLEQQSVHQGSGKELEIVTSKSELTA